MGVKSGIYEILNTTNGHRYVGSAVNLRRRKSTHWRRLRQKCHENQHLQRAWNKYGESVFDFDVIEYWEPEFLVSFEQWWMNMLRPEYNINPVAGSSLGVKRTDDARANMSAAKKGHEVSAEARAKISKAHMGNTTNLGRKHTAESKANMSAAAMGKKRGPMSEEHKSQISAALMGREVTPETRAKISKTLKGYKHTDETKAKMSAAQKKRRAKETP